MNNKRLIKNIIMWCYYKRQFKGHFEKPCVTGLQPFHDQCPIINFILNMFYNSDTYGIL